jgi:hypothetical protein
MRPILTLPLAAFAVTLAGCSSPPVETPPPLPAILAEHQFFPAEEGFLRSLGNLDTPRSDADLVNAGHAACRAILDEGATRADLAPALSEWAEVDTAAANTLLTAASGNMCETALLFDS